MPDAPEETADDERAEPDEESLSGLQWLSRERPEAMQHLLAFFRESGRHLDSKTRFLISVVTKVVSFSPRGLRQYIPRAAREGASSDEILDAILCAYPAAGLTNVIDAVQVLRELDLDARDPAVPSAEGETETRADDARPSPDAGAWVTVAQSGAVAPGTATVVSAGGQRLALYNVDGTFHATGNACLHQGGELGCSLLDGHIVTCHRHGWAFDVTNGSCLTRPGEQVPSFPVRLQGDAVQVLV